MNGNLVFKVVTCLGLLFVLSLLFTGPIAEATIYRQKSGGWNQGALVDPILDNDDDVHSYSTKHL